MPDIGLPAWMVWALLSAVFAALTTIFAKVGVASIDPDLATYIRTVVILVVLGGILVLRGRLQPLAFPVEPMRSWPCREWRRGRPGSAIFVRFNSGMPRAWPRSTS